MQSTSWNINIICKTKLSKEVRRFFFDMLKIVRVTSHFLRFFYEKNFFQKSIFYVSLDLFIWEIKKFVFWFKVENFGTYAASRRNISQFEILLHTKMYEG